MGKIFRICTVCIRILFRSSSLHVIIEILLYIDVLVCINQHMLETWIYIYIYFNEFVNLKISRQGLDV